MKLTLRLKGGPGSGHWGHAGRLGKVGGSLPGNVALSIRTGKTAEERRIRKLVTVGKLPESELDRFIKKPERPLVPTGSKFIHNQLRSIKDKKDLAMIRRNVKNVPQQHLDTVESIETGYYAVGEYKNTAGTCDKYNSIKLYTEPRFGYRNWNNRTLLHEIGHAVVNHDSRYKKVYAADWRKLYRSLRNFSEVAHSVWQRNIRGNGRPAKGFPSKYAMTNSNEFFAESYMLYIKSPVKLKRMAPEAYAIMRDAVFGGIEYVKD